MNSGKRIVEQLTQALQKGGKDKKIICRDSEHSAVFQFDVADFGKFSTVFSRIGVSVEQKLSAQQLETWATRLRQELASYLNELDAIEFDRVHSQVQLRSAVTKGQSEFDYFQVLVDATGSISIEKIHYKRSDNERKRTTFSFTNERLAELVSILTKVVTN